MESKKRFIFYKVVLYKYKEVISDEKESIKRALSSGNGYVHADRMWQQACRQ